METNVVDAFGEMAPKLQEVLNSNKKPMIEFQLLPIDELESVAKNESERLGYLLSKGIPREMILDPNRGISNVGYMTQLRHLWLYLGTVTFAYALSVKCTSNNFRFYCNEGALTARGTIVQRPSKSSSMDSEKQDCKFIDTFYVRLDKNGIGLDRSFYKFVGRSDFDGRLYDEK